jgi:hypothetical protein
MTTDKRHNWMNTFDVIYVKDYVKAAPKKGGLDRYFGFRYNMDFHIVSELSRHRYLDIVGSYNVVLKTPNGRNGQTWFFDMNTKTIKNR